MQHVILFVLMFSFTAGIVTIVIAELYRRRYPMRILSGIRDAGLAFNILIFSKLIYIYLRFNLQPPLNVGQREILIHITQLVGTILVFIYVFFLIVLFLDLVQNPVSKQLRRCYWFAAAALFFAQLLSYVTDLHVFLIPFTNLVNSISDVGSMAFLIGFSVFAFFRGHKIKIAKQRKLITNITAFYIILFFLLPIFWITWSFYGEPINFSALAFSFLFLIFNLAPLFFMNPLVKMHLVAYKSADQLTIPKTLDFKFGITNREMEIIKLIAEGNTNKEISDILFIAHQTVKDHNRRIFMKLGVKNRVQLVNLIRNIQISKPQE